MNLQSKINSGEIELEDQRESYERSKKEFKQLMSEERARKNKGKNQSPSPEYLLSKYAQVKEKLGFADLPYY